MSEDLHEDWQEESMKLVSSITMVPMEKSLAGKGKESW
jgi:hypothetical protein